MATNSRSSTQNAALGARLSALEVQVGGLHDGLERLATSVESLAHDVRKGRLPQYGTIFAGLGVLVAILSGLIVLGARGPLETLADLKVRQDRRIENGYADAKAAGAREARIESIEATVLRLVERAHAAALAGQK